ncbi:alpha/beta fold hydrolase [Arthrobacter halodurans]|uniref:Alpha/beta fold hydrolase n=1 Tax=Arthrobacter halodurans TaxID=516699 RepID=A0ABV4UMF2_9MICC
MSGQPGYGTADVPVPGGVLRVGVWGPGDPGAPTVLAVHGITASHRAWGLVAAALPGVRVIAPDLRGRGRSNRLPGPHGMPAHADDLAAVLEHFGAGPVPVVGHSMGAFAALVLAHRRPDLVESLLLVDGGLPLVVPDGLDNEGIVQAVLGPAAERLAMEFADLDAYRGYWAAHPAFAGHWNDLVEDYVAYDLRGEPPHLRASTSYGALAEDTAELHGGPSLAAALEGLARPALLLRSPRGLLNQEPGLFTADYARQWADRLPGLRVRDVADTNHYTIIMDHPGAAAVAAEVRTLLGGGRDAAAAGSTTTGGH